jgi:adenine-specific DNA-methyltransferase
VERRLLLAKELLNPDRSALIVTIDEKEVHRLALLLDQTFPGVRTQMVSSVINPAGTGRQSEFSRTNEYIFFLQFGDLVIQPMAPATTGSVPVEWEPFRRRDLESRRGTSKGGRSQFYPIYVDRESKQIVGTGDPLPHDSDRRTAPARPGCASVFPVREDGTEMNWALTREEFERRLAKGYVRLGRHQPDGHQEWVVSYLRTGPIADIEEGRAVIVGRKEDGSVIARYPTGKRRMPLTQWDFASHDAQRYGTTLLNALIPGQRFPFPKSLYAVEDALRIAVGEYPEAVVLDFFGGSGTTAHAVARLNREDGGRRRSIVITNNEVSAAEAAVLRRQGARPGDPEWEALGIYEHITRPRIAAAITGRTPEGTVVKGDYKFNGEYPMAEGLEENVEFLSITYEMPVGVGHNRSFDRIAPLLWLRAGARGARVDQIPAEGWAVVDAYGVLFDLDQAQSFCRTMAEAGAGMAFVVTDDDRRFQAVVRRLPEAVEPVRLYESYLSNFRFASGE